MKCPQGLRKDQFYGEFNLFLCCYAKFMYYKKQCLVPPEPALPPEYRTYFYTYLRSVLCLIKQCIVWEQTLHILVTTSLYNKNSQGW